MGALQNRKAEEEKEVTTPVIKANKQYGDQKALDVLTRTASGLRQGNADLVPTERRGVGRPAGAAAQPAVGGTPAPEIPPEHIVLMEEFARRAAVAQRANAAAQDPLAGPWLRAYAEQAQVKAEESAQSLRSQTPFFNEG